MNTLLAETMNFEYKAHKVETAPGKKRSGGSLIDDVQLEIYH
jgi:hypothetical protein